MLYVLARHIKSITFVQSAAGPHSCHSFLTYVLHPYIILKSLDCLTVVFLMLCNEPRLFAKSWRDFFFVHSGFVDFFTNNRGSCAL